MTTPVGEGVFADVAGIESATRVLESAADGFAKVDGAALDSGIPLSFPGGSATAKTVADAAAAVDRAAAALSDRSHGLATACRAALRQLQITDEEFALALGTAVPQ